MTFLRAGLAGLALFAAAMPALAGQLLEVQTDKSRMLTLPATPGAIVIGNPSIADVTVNGDKIFVHGRAFGETNLLVLGLDGNPIMEYDLVTKHQTDTTVALFTASRAGVIRQSYSCYPLCEAEMQVGDDSTYFGQALGQAKSKTEFATGQDTAEAKAPAAPQ